MPSALKPVNANAAFFVQRLTGQRVRLGRHELAAVGAFPLRHTAHSPVPEAMLPTYDVGVDYGCDFNWRADRGLKANDPAKTILQPKNKLEADDRSPRMWSVHQVDDRQKGHDEVRAGRREPE